MLRGIVYVTRSIECVGLVTGRDAFRYCPYSFWDSGCSRFPLGVGAKWGQRQLLKAGRESRSTLVLIHYLRVYITVGVSGYSGVVSVVNSVADGCWADNLGSQHAGSDPSKTS